MLKIINLSKKYDGLSSPLFSNLSFEINKGECLFIQGVSGVGKTTLLSILALLDVPDSGEIVYENLQIINSSEKIKNKYRNEKMGIIFQKYNLLSQFTVVENVMLPLLYKNIKDKKKIEYDAIEILNKLEMGDFKNRAINSLSGGQQQRVAIARVLLQNPDIILADEPSANVDKKTEELIMLQFEKHKKEGKILIVVSHNNVYERIADYKMIMTKEGIIYE